jgi:hypothetical protein
MKWEKIKRKLPAAPEAAEHKLKNKEDLPTFETNKMRIIKIS